jgi:cytochrome c oxidase subunit 1
MLFIGTNVAFFPQHMLGLDGMIRRIADYAPNAGWTELNFLSTIGAFLIAASILPFLWNVFITMRRPQDAPDDPWDANTLEWATSSPPPPYNFATLPPIRSERPLFDLKRGAVADVPHAIPAARGETHGEMREDAPEERLGVPVEGHEDESGEPRGVAPGVSAEAPESTPVVGGGEPDVAEGLREDAAKERKPGEPR